MTLLQSFVLGAVQGIAEFLPISSSAHLIILPWLFGWDDGGLTFDVALHFGTLVAILIFFRAEWALLIKSAFRLRPHHFTKPETLAADADLKLACYIIVATVPGAIMGLLLEKKAEHAFRNPALIAITLSVMGVILWATDHWGKKARSFSNLRWADAIFIGIAQGFAVIPGVSRAGVTISTALARGMDRATAARFSFLLSMPIIAGACLLKLRHLTLADLSPAFVIGVLAAAFFGYIAIGGLLRFLQTQSYRAFAVYRILVALGIVALVMSRSV